MRILDWWEGVYARCFSGNALLTGAVLALALFALMIAFVGYLVLLFVHIRRTVKRRKLARAAIERKVAYTLPDRENSFLRDRLNTVLKVPTENVENADDQTVVAGEYVQLSHVRKLLTRLQSSALSPADRLETEEMGKLLGAYLQKSRFSVSDLRLLNDMFSSVLKLSAKYGV